MGHRASEGSRRCGQPSGKILGWWTLLDAAHCTLESHRLLLPSSQHVPVVPGVSCFYFHDDSYTSGTLHYDDGWSFSGGVVVLRLAASPHVPIINVPAGHMQSVCAVVVQKS